MKTILNDIRSQCVYGASDQLTTDDRETILANLEKLRDQVYSEGNADYAGRTVFTGYRTNQKLTFMKDDSTTSYDITQSFSYGDIEEYRYYSDEVTVPTTAAEVTGNTISDPKQSIFDRVRLSYGEIDSIVDKDGNVLDGGATSNQGTLAYSYTDANGTVQNDGELNVTVYDTLEDWAAANADNEYSIPDGEAVLIKETGELILSTDASSTLRSGKATFDLDYNKTGFDEGEVRPEYYFNCTNVTDPDNPIDYVKYKDGKEIYQDIEYVVSGNQTLTVNTQASAVLDSSIGRDIDAMIEAVRFAQEANAKVEELEKMQKMQEYASDDCQAALEEWLAAAQKEADYADDNLQKLYNSYIGNFDEYLQKVNLAVTDVGSKGKSLE
ncbi:MAG: flagellar hook-associated protein 3, partial [Firmicutes bacterium]|nr:flagellar hook-associated protein 3 [Bacillota bacterium]